MWRFTFSVPKSKYITLLSNKNNSWLLLFTKWEIEVDKQDKLCCLHVHVHPQLAKCCLICIDLQQKSNQAALFFYYVYFWSKLLPLEGHHFQDAICIESLLSELCAISFNI